MTKYTFKPFGNPRCEIRILTIQPGSASEPLHCSLQTASLDSLPAYEALSYTWGDNATKQLIEIDGEPFVAFGNAHDALLELRNAESPRMIWIDAICINQEDMDEKQHQILLMKLVYERSSQVVIWLSKPRSDADLAVKLLDELCEQHNAGTHTVQSMQAIHRPKMRSPEWTALRDFLHHPWWRRVWTFQEVVVGRKVVVQFGQHTIPWERLRILGDDNSLLYGMFVKEHGEGLDFGVGQGDGCSAIPTIEWLQAVLQTEGRCSLLDILPQCWFRQATDIRDCIFGLCALASDADSLGIVPNYKASVDDVLTDTVQKLILHYGTFELFCKAGLGFERNLSSLPSYVPDWTNIPTAQSLHWHFTQGPKTLPIEDRGISQDKTGRLQLQLYQLDSIAHVTTPLTNPSGRHSPQALASWFDTAEQLALRHAQSPYPIFLPPGPSITLFDAFWRTTIANSTDARTPPSDDAFHGYLRWKFTTMREYFEKPSCAFIDIEQYKERYLDPMDDSLASMMDWFNTMLITSWDRAFCVTRGGLIGLVPGGTRPGDLVCLIPGGAVPYVMRRAESEGEVALVGESYVHGVGAILGIEQLKSEGREPDVLFLV